MYQNLNRMMLRVLSQNFPKLAPKVSISGGSKQVGARTYSDLIPPTQYDVPIPPRLHLTHVLKVYWETIPLFVTTGVAVSLMIAACIYSCRNKVDVVFSTHNRDCISRTMDLRNPSVHKVIIINQRYEPWPEMQDLLDKMKVAEKRALVRAQTCSHP